MYMGVDGCPAGWFAVILQDDPVGEYDVALYPTIADLWQQHHPASCILLDMPIGIATDHERATESAVRSVLGPRRSSVFAVPIRDALYTQSYEQASTINQRITGKKLSKQTWNIIPRIREVDQFLRNTPDAQSVIFESHPEVLFAVLNHNRPMPYTKKTGVGFWERFQIAEHYLWCSSEIIRAARNHYPASDLADDDIMDALILAIGAQIGHLKTIPEEPEHDAYGLPMQVVYPDPTEAYMARIVGIHHVQITVPPDRVDDAREFYCGVLALPEIEKPDSLKARGGLWIQVGDRAVHIGVEDDFDRTSTKAHIAYQVDDLTYWRSYLAQRGLTIIDSIPIPDHDRFEFRDPFGNRVEMIQIMDS